MGQAWTRQAWNAAGQPGACSSLVADQHKDWVVRNMLLICGCASVCGCGSGSADDARAVNEFRSNIDHKPWPTYEDVAQWLTSEGASSATGGDGTANTEAMETALLAAIDDVSESTGLQFYTTDADDVVVVPKEVAKVPPKVRLATIMHAARLYRRRLSPDGTLGASAFGGAVRVGKYDPDVKDLLMNYRRVGVA